MAKLLYIVAGFGESTQEKPYQQIARFARKSGYTVVLHTPTWARGTPSQWIEELETKIAQPGTTNATLFGFSFGAFIAINTATRHSFNRIIACSLPPFFKEDIPDIESSTRAFLGVRRMQDLENYPFPAALRTRITLMSGAEEDAEDLEKMAGYHAKWAGPKKKTLIPGAEHDLESKGYLEAIKAAIA
jgi:pimeloyl-ACP methyl ester carboxylesterase